MEHISTILERVYKEIVIVYNENRNGAETNGIDE